MSIPDQLLKHIPCPNGSSCASARCLFGHPTAEQTPASAAALEVPGSFRPSTALADKRVKTDSVGYQDSKSPPWTAHVKSMSLQDTGSLLETPTAPKLLSPSRLSPGAAPFQPKSAGPDSPSVLKRKRAESSESSANKASSATPGRTTANPPASSSSSSSASASTTPVATSSGTPTPAATKSEAMPQPQPPPPPKRKPETLNPRYVALAPAKHETRVKLVRLLHYEFTRLNRLLHASKDRPEDRRQFLLTPQGLIWLALDTEEQYATSKSSTVYADTIKHRIMEFKRMTISQWVKERKEAREKAREKARLARQSSSGGATPSKTFTTEAPSAEAKVSVGSGNLASQGKTPAPANTDSPPNPIVTGLPPSQDIALLQMHFLTPIKKLANHGFVPTVPTDADIQRAIDAQEVSRGWEQCERCLTRFQVFPGRRYSDGALASGGQCVHHPGRFKRIEQIYDCCYESNSGASKGCDISPSHVFKVTDPKRLAALWNFVETPPNPTPENVHEAVCFDCEMAYTVYGMEVVRVTATSWPKGDVILDILVRPLGSIMDFNSKFSGVFASDFAAATPYSATWQPQTLQTSSGRPALPLVSSPQVARGLLYRLISPETILIGHALENDLRALRMVHHHVSDTALLFPHPKGLPIRYSLRVLAKEHMGRVVQAGGNVTGHDSAEDARVAGELVLTKIKKKWETMRRDGWMLVDGKMTKDA